MKDTSLSREVIERAARRLKEVGPLQVRSGIRARASARLTEMPEPDTRRLIRRARSPRAHHLGRFSLHDRRTPMILYPSSAVCDSKSHRRIARRAR
jgi:hypothetical protein